MLLCSGSLAHEPILTDDIYRGLDAIIQKSKLTNSIDPVQYNKKPTRSGPGEVKDITLVLSIKTPANEQFAKFTKTLTLQGGRPSLVVDNRVEPVGSSALNSSRSAMSKSSRSP